jgi:hypothetical protein
MPQLNFFPLTDTVNRLISGPLHEFKRIDRILLYFEKLIGGKAGKFHEKGVTLFGYGVLLIDSLDRLQMSFQKTDGGVHRYG